MSLFLIGAGFNVDAGRRRMRDGSEYWYPLVADIARHCFNLEPAQIPSGKYVEDLFWDARERHDSGPMKRLTEKLMQADYYLAQPLAPPGEANCYSKFFDTFDRANFLTFNYDSLPEIFLFRRERWYPEDGYGVPVRTELSFGASVPAGRKSSSMVLHLHGSLCLWSPAFEIHQNAGDRIAELIPLNRPRYNFAPHVISSVFTPYRGVLPDRSYKTTDRRVIAPVPNKASDLEQDFIREIYTRACQLVRDSGPLIAIGYSFNTSDQASYGPVLKALEESRERKLIVVSPNASEPARRIRKEYPRLHVEPIERTLKSWVADSFCCY